MIGRTHVINLGAGNSYDQLRTISSQDSAIGITLYRYSVFTYDLLKMVKDRGGTVSYTHLDVYKRQQAGLALCLPRDFIQCDGLSEACSTVLVC